jgi:hypothetical protein
MKGLSGVQGRRVCDRQMQGNMIAVCRGKFPEGSQELSGCLNTAETMFTAVYTIQESLGGQLDNSYKCPGQVGGHSMRLLQCLSAYSFRHQIPLPLLLLLLLTFLKCADL